MKKLFIETIELCEERIPALIKRLFENEEIPELLQEQEDYLLTEAGISLTYFELRKYLEYMSHFVINGTAKTVITELIRVLAKLEVAAVRVPGLTAGRIKMSRAMLKR